MAAGPDGYIKTHNTSIFLSWSGKQSREFTNIFHEYVSELFPYVELFFSTDDIRNGQAWRDRLDEELLKSELAIIFLTHENLQSRWIYFEAGALSKSINNQRIIPFLIGLKPENLPNPLADYQAKVFDKDGLLSIVHTINECLPNKIQEEHLNKHFERMWPEICEKIDKLSVEYKEETPTNGDELDTENPKIQDAILKSNNDKLDEIISLLRKDSLQQKEWQETIKIKKMHKNSPDKMLATKVVYAALDKLEDITEQDREYLLSVLPDILLISNKKMRLNNLEKLVSNTSNPDIDYFFIRDLITRWDR